MNLLGIVQAYTALAESLARIAIAGNVASALAESDTSIQDHSLAPNSAPGNTAPVSQAGRGLANSESANLPDAPRQKNRANAASQSLIGLRAPNSGNHSSAGSLRNLITSQIVASNLADSSDDPDPLETAIEQKNTILEKHKSALIQQSILRKNHSQTASQVILNITNQAEATERTARSHSTKPEIQTGKNISELTNTSHHEATVSADQLNKPNISASRENTSNDKTFPLAHEQIKIQKQGIETAQAPIGKQPLGEVVEALLNATSSKQGMVPMTGMEAAILNAAMIPGWPAPRPFEMPKKIPPDQLQRMKASEAEKATELGASTQQKTKDGKGRNEVAIQSYLLNMGLNRSLLRKIKNALRPAKNKLKVMFGLAVLVTQVVFTLHTVLDELNQIEEDENDMLHDPSEQKRRLKG